MSGLGWLWWVCGGAAIAVLAYLHRLLPIKRAIKVHIDQQKQAKGAVVARECAPAPPPPAPRSRAALQRAPAPGDREPPPPGDPPPPTLPKLPLPDFINKRTYLIPRPIIQLPAGHEPSDRDVRQNKFSVTRSPSLEKDDRSPFPACSTKFGFDQPCGSETKYIDIEKGVVTKEMSDNDDLPPKELTERELSPGSLRRFTSVSTRLNMCSVSETSIVAGQQERSEMQNSPRILECSSAKEKSNVSKFDFSPRLLSESSPKFFTPPEMVSPMFFVDPSPKSVYYDSVRSPKFFPETPRLDEVPQSPRALLEQQNRNSKPNSPRILTPKPKSPKVYSANKENYFTFDNVQLGDDGTRLSPKPKRYAGRNTIERERFTPPEDKEVKKYRRHNSCEASYKQAEILTKPEKSIQSPVEDKDVVDCCAKMDSVTIVSELKIDQSELLSAQMRRQRLKSISLDSDNAKIIEQNLGLPIAKHMKEQMNEAYKQDLSTSCESVDRFKDKSDSQTEHLDCKCNQSAEESSPPHLQKKSLRQATDAKSFIDMPRFSPKEFEITVTSEEGATAAAEVQFKKTKNLRNLTIDLTKRDTDLEREIEEFEKLYTDAEEKKVKTPTLKIKATSLDSSESANLSLPPKKTLDVPQNSVSVPNTPKKQLKRLLAQKTSKECAKFCYGTDQRRLNIKGQDSGIFLRENHASLMLYQPGGSRTMGSFDENIADMPSINISKAQDSGQSLGANLINYKPNLSVSSTNLKTLPEGVSSDDFEVAAEVEKVSKKLNRRNSNQMLSLESKYSAHSSSASLSSGASSHNLVRNSLSNYSLNTDNLSLARDRRDSNATARITTELPSMKVPTHSDSKSCLLQRRGSNNSLTLNITPSLSRHSSNTSLNKDAKVQKKGLLERRSSNTSLTLNINNSNPQLSVNRSLSISNYNLNGSTCNLSNVPSIETTEPKKGILERRSSNTSLTLNIEPRVVEIDEIQIETNLKEVPKHRKSLSSENLLPKSYRIPKPSEESKTFGSHSDLWSQCYPGGGELTLLGGRDENELVYACGKAGVLEGKGFTRNITTKPLSPHTTSEDFRLYLANMHHLQNASNVLSRQKLLFLHDIFQNGYASFTCSNADGSHSCLSGNKNGKQSDVGDSGMGDSGVGDSGMGDSGVGDSGVGDSDAGDSGGGKPCSEYQKMMLRNLHQEFWDMPTNFQEKPIVSGSHPKNRYKSILPNEHSRFPLAADEGASGEAYINANYIKGHEYTKSSYIATQGPLQNTIYDFWAMIAQNCAEYFKMNPDKQPENFVQKIVMLTNFVENNRPKCDKYFPIELNEELAFKSEPLINTETGQRDGVHNVFLVKNCGVITKQGYTIRKLKVKLVKKYTKVTCDSDKSELSNYVSDSVVSKSEHFLSEFKSTSVSSNIELTSKRDTSIYTSNVNQSLEGYQSIASTSQYQCNQFLRRGVSISPEKPDSVLSQCTVYHYWFHNWADHKCPKDVNALLCLSLDILSNEKLDFNQASVDVSDSCTCSVSPKVNTKFVFPPSDTKNNTCSMSKHDTIVADDTSHSTLDTCVSSDNNQPLVTKPFNVHGESITTPDKFTSETAQFTSTSASSQFASTSASSQFASTSASSQIASTSASSQFASTSALSQFASTSNQFASTSLQSASTSAQFASTSSKFASTPTQSASTSSKWSLCAGPACVVHCSAGVGRTGCLLAALCGLQQLRASRTVDVLATVSAMRLQRGGMVQSSEQYELIHKVLCLYESARPPATG